MAYDLITLQTTKELAAAGAIRVAQAVGTAGGFAVQLKYGLTVKTLQAKRGHPRVFKTLDAAAKVVRRFGVEHLEADLSGWTPAMPKLRDDKAVAMAQLKKAMSTIRTRVPKLSDKEAQALADEAVAFARRGKAKT